MDEQTTPKKVRRVGTLAFALVLILAGVLLMIYQLSCSFCRRNHDGISAGNGNILGILCDNLQNIGIRRS